MRHKVKIIHNVHDRCHIFSLSTAGKAVKMDAAPPLPLLPVWISIVNA